MDASPTMWLPVVALIGGLRGFDMAAVPPQSSDIFSREKFSRLLNSPGMVPDMFLPIERSQWINGLYTLGPKPAPLPAGVFSGLRLQVPDPRSLDETFERNVQRDLVQLVATIDKLRKAHPDLGCMVLSKEIIVAKDKAGIQRARFGLSCNPASEFRDDVSAAAECHKQIVQSFRKGWFAIESEPTFDASRGFTGLADWANGVRLKKSFNWPWLALLLLLPFLLRGCQDSDPIAGVTKSFIIVIDRSSSMQPHFAQVQEEARKTLGKITDSALNRVLGFLGEAHYVDLVSYDSDATSLFNELRPVTKDTADQVLKEIDGLQAAGGTIAKAAMDLCAREIEKHGKETTICIFTDGQDESLTQLTSEMQSSPDAVKKRFGMTPESPQLFHVNTISPRLLDVTERTGAVAPIDEFEGVMSQFSQAYFGVFGFAGAAFGQRGLPASHRVWNFLLWLARLAVVGVVGVYAYPRLKARFGHHLPSNLNVGTR